MKFAILGLALALSAPAIASAQTIAALTSDSRLVHIDVESRRATHSVAISGVSGPIAGIDLRPSDGALYALSFSGAVYTINPMTGAATFKSLLRVAPSAAGAVMVDFNPVADRLRIISASGANLRAHVDTGAVTVDQNLRFAEGADQPNVIAGAYTNSVAGATETTLLDIDASGRLLRQAPPNDGVLNPVGALGASPAAIAFDISSANQGMAVAGGVLHSINLETGAATALGRLRGVPANVQDIVILP